MALPIDRVAGAVTRLSQTLNAQLLDCDTATISLITSRPAVPGPQRYLLPTGPCTIGAHALGDSIHLVCVTDNSQSTFWAYVAECLENEDLPRRDGIVAQTSESGGPIWLHYCGVSSFRQRFEPLTLDQQDVSKLNALPKPESAQDRLWDARALLRSVRNDDFTMLRNTYTVLRTWAKASGVFCAELGTFDVDALLAMVYEVCSGLWSPAAKDAGEAITRITIKYADSAQLKLLRTPSGRVAYSPDRDIGADGAAAIAAEMRRAYTDPRVMHFSAAEHFNAIKASFGSCIQISAECWAPKQRAAFQARLVPEIALMFSKLRSSGALKCERCRIWPHAIKQSEDEWVYFIFVDESHAVTELVSAVEQHVFASDKNAGSAQAAVLADGEFENAMSRLLTTPPTPTPSGGVAEEEELASAIGDSPPGKFPTASAVLSRLRWDPKYAAEHYEVGYMDQFVGLLWLPLEKWGHATEDEEFIPAHRIRTFRRVRDGAVASTPHSFVAVTGLTGRSPFSGLGFAICCRLIDEFLTSRPLSQSLNLLFSTRDARKSEDTRKRLIEHICNGGGGRRGSDDPVALQRVKLEGVSVDLTQLRTVKELAEELLRKGEKLDRVICNAGIGGWLGTDFAAGALALIKNPIQAATYPLFQISDVGALAVQRDASSLVKPDEKELPPLGQVFTANLFGHYLLLHWLMPILTPSSRLIWITSTTCLARFFSLQDPQCITSTEAYESSKRLTDLLVLTSNLPSTAPYTSKYLSSGNGSGAPKMYTTHPGILKTNIAPVPWFLDFMNLLTLYLVRLLGSPWHPVTPYPGASSAVFCALAPSTQLDDVEEREGKGKWGSAVGRLGGDSVRRTEVQGWGFCGKVGVVPDGSVDLKASRWPGWKPLHKEGREEFEVTGGEVWRYMETLRRDWEERLGPLRSDN
ncbi:3-keto-steroid reductase [Oleoguttula sp. CCFEE 5521]